MLAQKLKSGDATPQDIAGVEEIFSRKDCHLGKNLVVPYIKYVENLDLSLLIDFSEYCKDEYIISETINCLKYRGVRSDNYKNFVLKYCHISDSFSDDEVLISALGALSLFDGDSVEIRKSLKDCFKLGNDNIRDQVVWVAQLIMKIPEERRISPDWDGNLYQIVDSSVRKWIDSL